jgi:hypothetical protein
MMPGEIHLSALQSIGDNFVIDIRPNCCVIGVHPRIKSGLRMFFARKRPGGLKFDRTGESKGLTLCSSVAPILSGKL